MSLRDELLRRFPVLTRLPPSAGPGPYVVGGGIRDLLRGRAPTDIDVACGDAQLCAQAAGGRTIILGREDMTALRVLGKDGHAYDFTTLIGGHIVADLERRDFTVNAMAVDLATGALVDPFGGEMDLAARVVRMVRASNFDDDPLRLLKAVRMAILHELVIEEETLAAIRPRAGRIVEVAPERVTYELFLILSAGALREAVSLLRATGLDRPLQLLGLPVFADDVPLAGSLAILLADPAAHAARWRWSTRLTRQVIELQRLISRHDPVSLFEAGEEVARQLPAVLHALGSSEEIPFPDFATRPLLNGHEVAERTALTGPRLGAAIRELLRAQVRGEVGTREEAEKFVRGLG